MAVNRDQFMEQGFLILRNVIPPDELDAARASYEALLERQKAVWAGERKPDDPPGGAWETSPQPRMNIGNPGLLDEKTANAVDVWLHENTVGVSSQLLCRPEASVTEMNVMCSPVRDRGPANWHRDVHPIDMAPLQVLQEDVMENGPRYVQWNIPLYDDNVLWVVPGSHRRLNTEEENRQLSADPRAPLTGGIPAELKAGDGVVYINYITHWGSNYSSKLRRTIVGGHSIYPYFKDLEFAKYLSPSAQATFDRWAARSRRLQDLTESTLRAVINKDASAYQAGLDKLQPGVGEKGKLTLTIYLCKAAKQISFLKNPDSVSMTEDARRRAMGPHPITLNWGPEFAGRFSLDDAKTLWERFKALDAKLQSPEEVFVPGFQSGPMRYYFNEAPADFGLKEFVASWS